MASLAIFFLDLELGEVLRWGCLEPALGGYISAWWLLDELPIFYGEVDSDPDVLSPFRCRMEKSAQPMLQIVVSLALLALGNWIFLPEVHVGLIADFVVRHFSEPSMVKSSLPSRAPAH